MRPRQAIFFLLDTQGANCVGCYRPDLSLGTTHIDRLAQEGVRFRSAYTCSPVCGPARSAIFTGLFPHSNGVIANDLAPHADLPTLGQRLERHGVPTAYVGKWHLDGSDYFGDGRCPPGWNPDYWFDGRNYLESLPDDAARSLSRQVLGPAKVHEHGITSEFTHAHRSADRAIQFLERHRDRDFLLVVSIDEPHHPFICPEPYASAFEEFRFSVSNPDDSLAEKPRAQREWAAHTGRLWESQMERNPAGTALRHPRHFACNSYADSQVGRVLSAIDRCTPAALVVHTSDHGDMFGSHGLHGKGPCAYEEIARVPLIARWPGHIPAQTVAPGVASHIDLVPTFLEFFGLPVPLLLQGESLLRRFRAPELPARGPAFIEFNRFEIDHDGFGAFAPIRAVCDAQFKLVLNLLDRDEFYDLTNDPGELLNLIDDVAHAAVRDALHAQLLDWMNRTRDPLRGPHWQRRPWAKDIAASTWGGYTRPRPFDADWFPRTLLYDTGKVADRHEYPKW